MEHYIIQTGVEILSDAIIRWDCFKDKKGCLAFYNDYKQAERAMYGIMQQYDHVRIICCKLDKVEGYVAREFQRRKRNG